MVGRARTVQFQCSTAAATECADETRVAEQPVEVGPQEVQSEVWRSGTGRVCCGTNVSLYRIHFHRYWTGVWWAKVGFLRFRQRSTPPEELRFSAISSYLTRTNAREVALVLTVLNHFHLFPSSPLAQRAERGRKVQRHRCLWIWRSWLDPEMDRSRPLELEYGSLGFGLRLLRLLGQDSVLVS